MKKFVWFILLCVGLFYLGKYYMSTGQFQEFIHKYHNPKLIPPVEYYLGQIGLIFGRWDFAIQRFSHVVEEYPDSKYAPDAQFYLAKSYEEKVMIRKAVEEYNKVSEKYPDSSLSETAFKRAQVLKQ